MYTILYHRTLFGFFTLHEALKALRLFYPGGTIQPQNASTLNA